MTIEELLASAMKSAPPLVVLVIVVVVMLKSRDRSDARIEAIAKHFATTTTDVVSKFDTLVRDTHQIQQRTIEALSHNTEAFRDMRDEMRSLHKLIAQRMAREASGESS